jgi:hypothetical protein
MEDNLDMDNLRSIIEEVFEVDVMMKGGNRNLVNSRKVFSKILTSRGYTLSAIGKYLEKDHTTIIHYVRDVDALLKYTPNVLNKYLIVKDKFTKVEGEILMTVKERELKEMVDLLNARIEELITENNNYKWNRLQSVISLIEKRTPIGKEEFMYRKINQLLNSMSSDE